MPEADDELVAANAAFYAAFEQRDLDAMSEVWLHEDHVVCTHPGWTSLHGWAAVASSWFALFQGDGQMQFILTKVQATVAGRPRLGHRRREPHRWAPGADRGGGQPVRAPRGPVEAGPPRGLGHRRRLNADQLIRPSAGAGPLTCGIHPR